MKDQIPFRFVLTRGVVCARAMQHRERSKKKKSEKITNSGNAMAPTKGSKEYEVEMFCSMVEDKGLAR